MNATKAAICISDRLKAGMPLAGRPFRTTGAVLLPFTSSATSFERVRSGPDSPPPASRPWQKAQFCKKSECPLATNAGGKDCSAGRLFGEVALVVRAATLPLSPFFPNARETRENNAIDAKMSKPKRREPSGRARAGPVRGPRMAQRIEPISSKNLHFFRRFMPINISSTLRKSLFFVFFFVMVQSSDAIILRTARA